MSIPNASCLVYGQRDGEHLRADIHSEIVLLVGQERVTSETGAVQMRDSIYCSVPKTIWLQVAEAIKGGTA